jgi:hypothetical protein
MNPSEAELRAALSIPHPPKPIVVRRAIVSCLAPNYVDWCPGRTTESTFAALNAELQFAEPLSGTEPTPGMLAWLKAVAS